MTNETLETRLFSIQGAINNALDDAVIRESLQGVGYDELRIKEGFKLYEEAHKLYIRQLKEYGEQFAATDDVIAYKQEIFKTYIKHVKLARIAFADDRHAYQSLGLNGDRMRSHTGLLHQMYAFYENALLSKDMQKQLMKYGITGAVLAQGKQAADKFREKLNKQMDETGEAQDFTNMRDQAFDTLDKWMGEFRQISRIALEDRPHLLEKLGIQVDSQV